MYFFQKRIRFAARLFGRLKYSSWVLIKYHSDRSKIVTTLTCQIIMQQTLFFFGKNPSCTSLLGPARLLILKNFPSCTFIPSCTIIKFTHFSLLDLLSSSKDFKFSRKASPMSYQYFNFLLIVGCENWTVVVCSQQTTTGQNKKGNIWFWWGFGRNVKNKTSTLFVVNFRKLCRHWLCTKHFKFKKSSL